MGRMYTVSTEAVNVTVAQDLVQVKGAAGKICRIRAVKVQCTTPAPTAQQIDLRMRFLPATVTDGSGGTSPTPAKIDPGDATASFTALANNTTKATTSGTAIQQHLWGPHLFAGINEQFASDQLTPVGPSESVVLELLTVVSGTVGLSTEVTVEEIGG